MMGLFNRTAPESEPVDDFSHTLVPYRAKALPYQAFRPLTAAAARIKLTNPIDMNQLSRRRMEDRIWQEDAWNAYDAIGEVKYAFNMMASVGSRVRLYCAAISDEGRSPTPVESTPDLTSGMALAANKSLDRLFRGASQGVSQMIRNMMINLSVVGECILVQIPAKYSTDTPESWEIRSSDEVVLAADRQTVVLRSRQIMSSTSARDMEKLPPDSFVGRIWRSHPHWSDEPDSTLRSVLDLCSELLLLNRTFRSTARSRLNAGALFIPDGLSAAADSDVHDIGEINPETGEPIYMPVEDTDAFETELLEAMTLPIQDESSASAVVPLLIRGPSELGAAIKQFKFERSFDPALAQRADRVLERILQGMDVPKEVVSGIAGIKYCVIDETQALTREGWKHYSELNVGDDILTLNHEQGYAEWQPIQAINVFETDPDEELIEIKNVHHHSITTKNHRWPVIYTHRHVGRSAEKNGRTTMERRFTTSEKLSHYDDIPLIAPVIDLPETPKYSDALVELVGWYWTEGCLLDLDAKNKNGTPKRIHIEISQSSLANPVKVDQINLCLTTLFGPPSKSVPGKPCWHKYQRQNGKRMVTFTLNAEAAAPLLEVVHGKEKIVSMDFIHQLTKSQLLLFIDSSIAGDGHVSKEGYKSIYQKNKTALLPFEMACILSGQSLSWYHQVGPGRDPYGPIDIHKIKIVTRTKFSPKQSGTRLSPKRSGERRSNRRPTPIKLGKVKVWCPTTANHTWYSKFDDTICITGNSNASQIDENLFKQHIEPLILLICDSLTSVYLHPALMTLGFNRQQCERVTVWYDPSEIVTRPNKSQDATDGFDRNIVSASTWRKYHGFAESDKPTTQETLIRLAVERGVVPPELVQQLLMSMSPELMEKLRESQQAENPAPVPKDVENILRG